MNEEAGRKAALYGRIGEDYIFKKYKLFRSGNSHDALEVTGNLFAMNSKPVEIKSAQLFLEGGARGQFIFTKENHEELVRAHGKYIFVFMNLKKVLFCLEVEGGEIDKLQVNRFKNTKHLRRKNEFFRINTNFFGKVKYNLLE